MGMTRWARVVLVLTTIACAWLTTARLSLSGDLTPLFPDKGEAAALGRFTRAFGGGDLAMVLVRGDDPDDVAAASRELGAALANKPSVQRVANGIEPPRPIDPTRAWIFAGPAARARLESALTPEGMRARLDDTRAMLLAPGASEASAWLARDPLRLASIPWESHEELAAGLVASDDGSFVANGGKARLVVAQPRGSAFESTAAARFVDDANDAMASARAHHPGVTTSISGGHAIAQATEQMIRRDFEVSGSLSIALASLVFLFTFRRARALAAVLPPLLLGTVWTTGVVAIVSPGLSAISIGFMAVVVGVGVDTGVHVYSALLDGRRAGLSPSDAARFARTQTWRPTLLAATAAGLAFGSLALSELAAIRQLGVLCGLGEVLTAIAILAVTPEIGIRLERGAPPPALAPAWIRGAAWLTRTRRRAGIALAAALLPAAALGIFGWPEAGNAIVALRPRGLLPLTTQDEIYALFGGQPGQWIVLSIDKDPVRATERADRVAEALERLEGDNTVAGYDTLSRFAPAPSTQRARLAARDALDLPSLRPRLEAALGDRGFDVDACAPALLAFAHPSSDVVPIDVDPQGPLAWLVSRHRAAEKGETIVATYVRPRSDPDSDARAIAAIHVADPDAVVTGYAHLETALKRSLARDLPRVALLALFVVAIALRAALGRARDVVLAMLTVIVELGVVAALMRLLHLKWHIYDALVLPVLIGITIDEAMFLLHAARDPSHQAGSAHESDAIDYTLHAQGPLVASTALTTAAGFAALLACRFEGLYDLGAVGALGSVAGLLCALVLVPAGLRVARSSKT
jgi:predicted RND superfamily exporter protein